MTPIRKVFLTSSQYGNLRPFSTTFCFNSKNEAFSKKELLIPKAESVRFMKDCMVAVGTPPEPAYRLALNLVEADYRGHFSHGLNRLSMYVQDIESGNCDPKIQPKVLKDSPATAWVDGQNGLGVVVGEFCMNLAIKKAKEIGVGFVSAQKSNHFGICQWYTDMAIESGMIGLCSTNTSPFLVPTRAKKRFFGTNPIAISAPGLKEDKFVLDMSTTSVAVGKIEIQLRKGEDLPSDGWAMGKDGKATTNAYEAFYEGNGLMPLGGSEMNSGYKGYGLAMAVDLLCALLSGAASGPNVRNWTTHDIPANLGQFFAAINPDFFSPYMKPRLQTMMTDLRELETAEDGKNVLVPGDPESKSASKVDEIGAIEYTPDHINCYKELANKLGVPPMRHL